MSKAHLHQAIYKVNIFVFLLIFACFLLPAHRSLSNDRSVHRSHSARLAAQGIVPNQIFLFYFFLFLINNLINI